VLLLSSSFGILIARQSSDRAANRSSDTISNATTKVLELTLGFLGLALLVLLNALLLQVLGSDDVAEHLLARTNGLIPLALVAIRIILGDAVRRGSEARTFNRGMGKVILRGSFGLLVLSLRLFDISQMITTGIFMEGSYLIGRVASDSSDDALGGASDGVDGGLKSGSVLVRHGEDLESSD